MEELRKEVTVLRNQVKSLRYCYLITQVLLVAVIITSWLQCSQARSQYHKSLDLYEQKIQELQYVYSELDQILVTQRSLNRELEHLLSDSE